MGYRLYVTPLPYKYICLGKLFGYEEDVEKLESFKYLRSLPNCWVPVAIPDEELYSFFGYGFNYQTTLSPEEFRKFYDLYKKEYESYNKWGLKLTSVEKSWLKEILEDGKTAFLSWEG